MSFIVAILGAGFLIARHWNEFAVEIWIVLVIILCLIFKKIVRKVPVFKMAQKIEDIAIESRKE